MILNNRVASKSSLKGAVSKRWNISVLIQPRFIVDKETIR